MTDHEFLAWLYDRLVLVYHESPNMDFVQRLRRIVDGMAPKAVRRTDGASPGCSFATSVMGMTATTA